MRRIKVLSQQVTTEFQRDEKYKCKIFIAIQSNKQDYFQISITPIIMMVSN